MLKFLEVLPSTQVYIFSVRLSLDTPSFPACSSEMCRNQHRPENWRDGPRGASESAEAVQSLRGTHPRKVWPVHVPPADGEDHSSRGSGRSFRQEERIGRGQCSSR